MINGRTEVSRMTGDPLDFVYINPPFTEEEAFPMVTQGLFREVDLRLMVRENDSFSLIIVGQDPNYAGNKRRERSQEIATEIVEILRSTREEVKRLS